MRPSIPTLALAACALVGAAAGPLALPQEPAPAPAPEPAAEDPCRAELERLRAALAAERAARTALEQRLTAEYESRIAELVRELRAEREKSLAREREWVAMTKALAVLELGSEPATVAVPAEAATAPAAEAAVDAEAAARAARDRELFLVLRSLLHVEEVHGLELLEAGRLQEGAMGPVVFRMLDPRGRPFGTLVAERLRLEGSDAGRTLTIVLERGYERRSGRVVPFEGDSRASLVGPLAVDEAEVVDAERARDPDLRRGVRRVVLPWVDPGPWRAAAPELFPAIETEPVAEVLDDGLYDRNLVRTLLNRLLRVDGLAGHWRLEELGGVMAGVLRDVQLVELGRAGRVERRLFADRLHLVPLEEGSGVLLLCESGVQVRGGRKAPFLDGRYRIYLPRADVGHWRRSGLPVLELEDAPAEPAPAEALPEPPVEPPAAEDAGSGPPR